MSVPLVIIGAGGFGRDVLDVVEAQNRAGVEELELLGFVDDSPSEATLKKLSNRGVLWLGGVEQWLQGAGPDVRYLIAIGNPAVRRRVDARLAGAGLHAARVVHPTTVMGYGVEVGEGSVVFAGVIVKNEVRIGRHVHLNMAATVGHDAVLGDFVTVNPRAAVSGHCVVEDQVMLGVGSVVLQGLRVAEGATVGGMACVVRDVPPGVTVKGVPAR